LLKNIKRELNVLQFRTETDFDLNLEKLISLIKSSSNDALVVAPEVCLTGFAYERFEEAAEFSAIAMKAIFEVLDKRVVILTMIEKIGNHFFNVAKVFSDGKIIHEQKKVHLFVIGDERKYFTQGDEGDISIFEVDGIKVGILICFELRFKNLWQKLEGCDLICVPAMWGKPRAMQFEVLTNALAVMNQCFVAASDSSNNDMARRSSIVNPFGEVSIDDDLESISGEYSSESIKKMRRYVNVGLS